MRWRLASLFPTKSVNLWLECCLGAARGAIGGWGDAITLLQLNNFRAKLPDTLAAWVVRGGSEVWRHLLVYCTEMIPPSPKDLLGQHCITLIDTDHPFLSVSSPGGVS